MASLNDSTTSHLYLPHLVANGSRLDKVGWCLSAVRAVIDNITVLIPDSITYTFFTDHFLKKHQKSQSLNLILTNEAVGESVRLA